MKTVPISRIVIIALLLVVSLPLHPATQQLTWTSSGQVGTFDLYLGTSNPPRLAVTGLTGTSYNATDLAEATTYYWYVVARAACDSTRTSQSAIKSFTTPGSCAGTGAFNLNAPADQSGGEAVSPTLNWVASAGAVAYDVYLGTAANPSLYKSDVTTNSIQVPSLKPGTTYFWKVVAKSACNAAGNKTSSTRSFTVGFTCSPSAPTIRFAPSAVASGQTYVVSWSDSTALDASGHYSIERSSDPNFASIFDKQDTIGTSASFIAGTGGTLYHRVRAVSGCTGNSASTYSASKSVTVNAAPPAVIFTVQPKPQITKLGDKLEDLRGNFVMENLSDSSVQVIVGQQDVNGSVPFFQIIDPFGGAGDFVTLEPRKPKTMELRFSGPPNDQAATYEGIISLVSTGEQFTVNPNVYVNLKVGGDTNAVAPKFLVGGIESEYVAFPPADGDDSSRPPITVDILNSGNVAMDVGGEIGPEMWLKIDKDWNRASIPASSFRTIRLSTQRNRAPNGSALPRYTYLTVRNKAGQSARLLVQDNGGAALGKGRTTTPETAERSYLVPFVTTSTSQTGTRTFSRVRISNVGSDPVQAELVYTPRDADGFDANLVQRATVVIPPNDVANFLDPLTQIFGVSSAQNGTLEVRAAPEKIGFLTVTSVVQKQVAGGGSYGSTIPVLGRGVGARMGAGQILGGVRSGADAKTTLLLIETTGREKTNVRVTLYDAQGSARGNQLIEVPRYGVKQIADLAQSLGGGAALESGRIELVVEQGGGAVTGMALISDTQTENAPVLVSTDVDATTARSPLGRPGVAEKAEVLATTGTITYFVPGVVNGEAPLSSESGATARTRLALTGASDAATTFKVAFINKNGQAISKDVTVAPRQTIEYANVLEELHQVPANSKTDGYLRIETDTKGKVGARVTAKLSRGSVGDQLTVLTAFDEPLTGGGTSKPLYADGVEQSGDPTKGTRSMLTLTEISGRSATVNIRLYEAGNRVTPIGEKDIAVGAGQQVTLDTIFSTLGLDSEDRRKDRANVAVVATVKSGTGLVSGLVTTIDNKTGETKKTLMLPAGGTFGGNIVSGDSGGRPRRRGVRR